MAMKRRFFVSIFFLLSLLPVMFTVSSVGAVSQAEGTPVLSDEQGLFTADGISSTVMARGDVTLDANSEAYLNLERILLPVGADLTERTALTPELLFVEVGSITIEDNFGFGSTTDQGNQLAINAGASYVLANDGPQDASVLRLSLTALESFDPDLELNPNTATPTALFATPIGDAVSVVFPSTETLIEQPVEALPTGDVSLFIVAVTFEPGSESGEYSHDGPLGIYVQDGTLGVLSPSGVEGQLSAGSGVVLPASAPLIASNDGDTEASALLVGVVESGATLVCRADTHSGVNKYFGSDIDSGATANSGTNSYTRAHSHA